MGDYCLPMRARILTDSGFKHFTDLTGDELVLSRSSVDGCLHWVQIISRYASMQPTITMNSKSFTFTCTPHHKWVVNDKTWDGCDRWRKIETCNLKSQHKLTITAPLSCSEQPSKISKLDAARIGWIVTDGHSRRDELCATSISQKKYKDEVVSLFGNMVTGVYAGNNGCATINLSRPMCREMFQRIGYTGKDSLPKIAVAMSYDCAKAFVLAMLRAEGWKERGHWRFSQKPGPVLEAFKIAATLCGYRLGMESKHKNGVISIRLVSPDRQNVSVNDLNFTKKTGTEPVWCITTEHGNFIAECDGQIAITGNCDGYSTSERAIMYSNGLHESSRKRHDEEGRGRIRVLAKELGFMKGRIIGMLNGNHYQVYNDGTNGDQYLANELCAKYLGVCAAVKVCFEIQRRACSILIVAHHGRGAGSTAGGRLNSVEKLAGYWPEADIVLMGDNHARGAVPLGDKLTLVRAANSECGYSIKSRKTYIARTGSFLEAYRPGEASYVVDAAMSPASLGWVEFEISFRRNYHDGRDMLEMDISATS